MPPSFQKLMVMLMDRYTEAINISNDICQNHIKYPENRGGGPESGSLPGFPCSPASYMAAISSQLKQHMSLLCSPGWNLLPHSSPDVKGAPCAVQSGALEPFWHGEA